MSGEQGRLRAGLNRLLGAAAWYYAEASGEPWEGLSRRLGYQAFLPASAFPPDYLSHPGLVSFTISTIPED